MLLCFPPRLHRETPRLLFSRTYLLQDGLIQAALSYQPPTLPVHFLQQHLSGGIDEAHPAQVHMELVLWRRRAQLPPALLKRADPWARQPPLHIEVDLPAILFVPNSKHWLRFSAQLSLDRDHHSIQE